MAFPLFSMLLDSEFQQRWEFRNQEVVSSSEDAKWSSGMEPSLKKHTLVPGLIQAETDDPAQPPECCEKTGNPPKGTVRGVITPNPKEATLRRRTTEKTTVKKEIRKRSANGGECRKTKGAAFYDTTLIDDLQKFRESLIEELSVERESLSRWMKDEINKMVGTNGASFVAESNKEADERPKKNAGRSKRCTPRPSGRSYQRKKKAESASCLLALANGNREFSELEHQQNSPSTGQKAPGSSTLMVEDKGANLELFHGSFQQCATAAASNYLIRPAGESHQPEGSMFNSPLKFTEKNIADELSGYYHHMLLPEGRSSFPNQMGPKNNSPPIQTVLSTSHLYRFSNMITDALPSGNPLGEKGNVFLGLEMNNGQQVRFPGYGNGFI